MGCAQSAQRRGISSDSTTGKTEVHPWSVDSGSGSSMWDSVPDEEEISLFYQYAVDKSRRKKQKPFDGCADDHGGSDTVGHHKSMGVGKIKTLTQGVREAFSRRHGAKSKSVFFRSGGSSLSGGMSSYTLPTDSDFGAPKDYWLTLDHMVTVAEDLRLQDMGRDEIARIYASMPTDDNSKVGLEQFAAAVREGPSALMLRLMVRKLQKGFAYGFKTPASYDFMQPTSENYKADDREFSAEFAHLRKNIDYSYHNNYNIERQCWQDEVIKSTIVRSSEQPAPWLVFTCGPMGVGKGYCMNWMSKHGFFPLENIVHVDPDAFKMMMPEWPKYVKSNGGEAGTLCHMESSLMMEVAQCAAMERRQNIWIDGSLRNADFYARVFEDIRVRYPHYRISIMYIYADEAVIRQRIKIRAERTGRNVPESLIQASLGAMDKALNKLTPLCDFVARINNSGEVPVLSAFATIDTGGSWGVLQDRFARKSCDFGDFPQFLAPLPLVRLPAKDIALFRHDPSQDALELRVVSDAPWELPAELRGLLPGSSLLKNRPRLDRRKPEQEAWAPSLALVTSPRCRVTLSSHDRRLAGIPEDAESYFWVFPLGKERQQGAELPRGEKLDPLVQFLFQGGFCFCSRDDAVISVHAVSSKREDMFLQFDSPQPLSKRTVDKLKRRGRLHPVAAPYLRQRGAARFCWVMPDEIFGKANVGGRHGAFVYLMEGQPTGLLFPVLSV